MLSVNHSIKTNFLIDSSVFNIPYVHCWRPIRCGMIHLTSRKRKKIIKTPYFYLFRGDDGEKTSYAMYVSGFILDLNMCEKGLLLLLFLNILWLCLSKRKEKKGPDSQSCIHYLTHIHHPYYYV